MKCPKCGSELDTGFNCPKCKAKSYKEIVSEYNTNGEKIYEKNTIKLVQPEPTTAEMPPKWCPLRTETEIAEKENQNEQR